VFEQFIGTKPVEERHRIDVASLERFLNLKIVALEQFKGGQSNPTYRLIDSSGKRYVLRRKPPGKLLPSAHAVEREYRVIKALSEADFPVARPRLLCEDDSVIGTAFYVMDFVDGRVLWDQGLPGMSKPERFAIWDELNRVIAKLHMLDYRALGLETFGKPGNYIERQVARWTKQYRASETERVPAMDKLIDWLPKNVPAGEATSIVHGDFRLDNMIFHPSEARVLALLDWELSTLGHPLVDLAFNSQAWLMSPDENGGLLGLPLEDRLVPGLGDRSAEAFEIHRGGLQ